MNVVLCASPRCRPPGRHTTECLARADRCRGCLPARAADGLRLCWHCTDHIGHNTARAAILYDECHLIAAATGNPASALHGGIGLNLAASRARTGIRARLLAWTRHISYHRGIDLPGQWLYQWLPPGVQGPLHRGWQQHDDNHTLAAYIGTHAEWLAAQPYAGLAADRMAELVSVGARAAYPARVSIVHIGQCIGIVDEQPCSGTVKALMREEDSLLPSAAVCDQHPTDHTWGPGQWHQLGRRLTARAAQQAALLAAQGITINTRITSAAAGHGGWPERRILS